MGKRAVNRTALKELAEKINASLASKIENGLSDDEMKAAIFEVLVGESKKGYLSYQAASSTKKKPAKKKAKE